MYSVTVALEETGEEMLTATLSTYLSRKEIATAAPGG
jgi:hypothetical protein